MSRENNNTVMPMWATPVLRKKFEQHQTVNSELVKIFQEHRRANDKIHGPVYSSPDDLLSRYGDTAINDLFKFISDSVYEIASSVNGPMWEQSNSSKINMNVVGAWFQIQNNFGFHDVHTHGNCSWSGAYYVQVDEEEKRIAHPQLGEQNGVTRFYSPYEDVLGGGYMDSGNLYLQASTFDSKPEEGVLVVFPSYLKHMALPYQGDKDRIIVSFNVQIHGDQGNDVLPYGFY
ncbi:MAG: hypothetical protein HUJ30_09670 [Gammaproteobacteria bacterium]|nr:hypothetical protein [Gammaproteobacteria bacterium]